MGDEELQDFLSHWKEEIQGDTGQVQSSRKRGAAHQRLSGPSSPSEHDDYLLAKRPVAGINDPPPLLVLPAVGSWNPQQKEECRKVAKNKEDLVCKLIADLDEINMIPFFEVRLPREIALVIFSYLSMKDLCKCAMVSKSWNSLAEDDMLWHRHYQKLLIKLKNIKLEVPSEWKSAVQDLIFQKQQVVKNWRERICGLSDYQPDDCRALCCFSYSNRTIFSCYSSGAVCVWDLSAENEPSRARQPAGPHLMSEPSCCDLVFPWGVVGTCDGCVKVMDVETCSQVHSFMDLGCVNCLNISCTSTCPSVGVAYQLPALHTRSSLSVFTLDNDGTWMRKNLPLGDTSAQLTKLQLLSLSNSTSCSLLYSTSTSLTLHSLHSTPTHILSSHGERGGVTCVSCFECDPVMSSVACGTSAFGYWVQLFDLSSGTPKASLKGHGQHVTALSFSPSTSHMIVSGSEDKRVRVFDSRCHTSFPSLVLRGHIGGVRCVKMDHWKVVSGSSDGSLIVWDKRMARELWNTHERHAVYGCCVDDPYLVCGHVPVDKHPIRINDIGGNPNICHRRLRGLVRVMDFSVDPLFYTKKLPSICSSAYDEPSASSFNLDLMFPYDDVY